jgi:hypothetical protein
MLAGSGLALTACGGTKPPTSDDTTPTVLPQQDVRDQLAGRVAAAKDRRYVARYRLVVPKRADRTITVAYAEDNSWVVSIPGGALGGLADIAMLGNAGGLFECVLGPAVAAIQAGLAPVNPGCVKVRSLNSGTDPRVQHIFTDWIDPLIDRETAISVARAKPLEHATGTCYSVESNSTQLAPPVDPGIYCYDADGTLTAARVGFGTLILTGTPGGAPSTITMPAAVRPGSPLPQQAPVLPKPTGTASASPQGSRAPGQMSPPPT